MYDRVPMNVLAIESISWPLTPKSHSFISPAELMSMFDGFISEIVGFQTDSPPSKKERVRRLVPLCMI
jgi:hypothetical protein